MSSIQKSIIKSMPKVITEFSTTLGLGLLSKATIQSFFRGQIRRLLTGSREKPYRIIPEIEIVSDRIIELFDQLGNFPSKICIDGMPGGGKSTLGRSLAQRTGLKWQTLFWKDIKQPYRFLPGVIYENLRLIRTQDVEFFDIVIYIDCNINTARQRILERDRNGLLADIVNLPKLKAVGDLAFDMLDGQEYRIADSYVRIKFKPHAGYNDLSNIKKALKQKHCIDAEIEKYSKEEMLLAYIYGRPNKGLFPYVNYGAYNDEILAGLSAALDMTIRSVL
jgi:hypothetical protein